MHHTIDKIPDKNEKNQKFIGKKNILKIKRVQMKAINLPKLRKNENKKNMKLGNKFIYLIIYLFFLVHFLMLKKKLFHTFINLDKIKPSFEEPDESENNDQVQNRNIREKNKKIIRPKSSHAILIGLDKITAKSSKIIVNLDESKKFGPLEIKILKCGKVRVNNKVNDVAYMQVKDLTKNENEKVLFSTAGPFPLIQILTPFDHAIYDLQLLNCYNV